MTEDLKERISDYSIVREVREKPTSMLRAHYHGHYEIYYLASGKVRYFIENMTFDLKAGDMILIAPHIIHRTASIEDKSMERVLLSFRSEFIGRNGSDPIFKCFGRYFIPDAGMLAPIFASIEKENKLSDGFSRDMIRCCIEMLLVRISRMKEADLLGNGAPHTIQKIAKYISDNYAAEISLDMLSEKFAISKSHLSRQFKSATGFGLSEYISLVRVKNAQRLLMTTNRPVTEIATACGFNDSSYFSAVFKKFLGSSPLRLRKNNF